MATTYKTKIDSWIVAMLCLPLLIGGGILAGGLAVNVGFWMVGAVLVVAYLLILTLLVFPMRYTIDDGLHIRSGQLIHAHITWDQLVSAEPTNNPLSSPALSLDRIALVYTKKNGKRATVMISPFDRTAFLRDLAAASPRHHVEGARLVAGK